jgi:acetyl-CoA carboxylase carboxyltransferase component
MTVWERFAVLSKAPPHVLFENWGRDLDGASIATAVLELDGRPVAVYGHDFTVRAGSMDATNGRKLARLLTLAGERGLPVIGLNDSAGAFVPAGVGGLDGYAMAFSALRQVSGVVPSIMCMFGFNAGGGSYLPRQGSFVIQPKATFLGLTGTEVVRSVLGEQVTPDELGGPQVHLQTGVADYTAENETEALYTARRLLSWLPDHNSVTAPYRATQDPPTRACQDFARVLQRAIDSATGYNSPMDITHLVADVVDDGIFYRFQPDRAQNTLCAFGRLDGHVVGFVANNSAVKSGQIDIEAAYKNARFIRFCNLYNIPLIFIEDTTGFLPGQDQEGRGIVQAGRAMLDAIIDVRTPRILIVVRNAYGGAYASYNNYQTGADWVIGLPTARIAVMGPVGRRFVYKKELAQYVQEAEIREQTIIRELLAQGHTSGEAEALAKARAKTWLQDRDNELAARYERELMNPKEGLALGSLSEIVMPEVLRTKLIYQMGLLLRHYKPSPFRGVQREFY